MENKKQKLRKSDNRIVLIHLIEALNSENIELAIKILNESGWSYSEKKLFLNELHESGIVKKCVLIPLEMNLNLEEAKKLSKLLKGLSEEEMVDIIVKYLEQREKDRAFKALHEARLQEARELYAKEFGRRMEILASDCLLPETTTFRK